MGVGWGWWLFSLSSNVSHFLCDVIRANVDLEAKGQECQQDIYQGQQSFQGLFTCINTSNFITWRITCMELNCKTYNCS